MKKSYSFKDCYNILNLTPDTSWYEIRRAYKKLIQKWHPDRYEANSKEKSAADTKIKAINIAYDQIHQYYRNNNNTLPQIETLHKPNEAAVNKTSDEVPHNTTAPPSTNNSQVDTKPRNKDATQKKQFRKKRTIPVERTYFRKLITITMLGSIYYLFADDIHSLMINKKNTDENSQASFIDINEKNTPQTTTKTHLEDNLVIEPYKHFAPSEQTAPKPIEPYDDVFFTSGSSIADVINIQGIPSRTDGDTWYYGDSIVYFKNGAVTHWVRSVQTPLKAKIVIEKHNDLN